MRRHEGFEEALVAHRRAVDECGATIRSVSLEQWDRSPKPGKWSAAQIAEHLALAYDPPLSELDGGAGFRAVVPLWMQRLLRWKYLGQILAGRMPRGVRAPREIRPAATSRTPDDGARKLSERAEIFLERLARADAKGRVRLMHPYLGRLSAIEVLKLLTSHARHHRRQIDGILGYGARPAKGDGRR